jgi:hypothetical protein
MHSIIINKNNFKISLSKFGSNKKLFQSLHRKIKNMQRIKLHIETANWFSPKGDYTVCGACNAEE